MNHHPILQVHGLSKAYPGVQALADVDLEVRRGEVHALMGENGAGKSTLMRILAGLESRDSGTIHFQGYPVDFRYPYDALNHGISMIHQELLPFPALTVAENIFVGQEPCGRGFPWQKRHRMFEESGRLLTRLGAGLSVRTRMGDLSVAEMQTVEIARALARGSSLLIMDEPTSALSDREVDALFTVIEDLKAQGTAIIYISHKMDEVFRIADRVTVLRDGRGVGTYRAGELNEEELIGLMVGRSLKEVVRGASHCAADAVLELTDLCRAGHFANVSLTVRRGEIVGLAGLMGAGRSQLLNAVYGLEAMNSGKVMLGGVSVRVRHPADALRAGIAWVGEDRRGTGLVLSMSVQQNLTLANLASCCRGPFIRSKCEGRTARDQIDRLGIRTAGPDQRVEQLSGGNQQKVVFAKSLFTRPKVLLLDEPTRGIDVGAKAEIYDVIRRLSRQGLGVLMASSELPELMLLCDRVLVMRQGRICAELNPSDSTPEEVMRYAMGAVSAG